MTLNNKNKKKVTEVGASVCLLLGAAVAVQAITQGRLHRLVT